MYGSSDKAAASALSAAGQLPFSPDDGEARLKNHTKRRVNLPGSGPELAPELQRGNDV